MPSIDAPVRPRRKHGLFSVVGDIGTVEGLTPVAFESLSCAGVQVRYPCLALQPDKVIPPTLPYQDGFEPFWIVSGYECRAFSDVDTYGDRALEALDTIVQRTIENELWLSPVSPSVSTLPVVGVGATPDLRLAAALDFISQCGGAGGGVLQVSAGTASALLSSGGLTVVGDQIFTTALGLPVFITSAPIGASIAITGGITVQMSEPTVIGGPNSWVDTGTNETLVVAERMAVVAWDGECCAGIVN